MTEDELRKEVGRLELKCMYAKELKANTEVFEAWRVRNIIDALMEKLEEKENEDK